MNKFTDINLSSKLAIAFGAILTILLLSTGIAFMAIHESSEGFKQYRNLARDTGLASRLQANMLMVRMNVKDFIITGSEKDLQQYSEYINKTNVFLAKAQEEIQKPERAVLVNTVSEQVELYDSYFEQVKKFQAQRNALVHETLNVFGPQMEKKLTSILLAAEKSGDINAVFNSGRAIRTLLLARLYIVKFLDTNAKADIERVKTEWTTFQDVLAELKSGLAPPKQISLMTEVQATGLKYYEAFDQLVLTIATRNEVITKYLDKMGPKIAADLEEVKLSVMTDQDALGPQLQSANDFAQIKIGVIAVIALLLGITLSLLVTRSVLKLLGSDPRELSVVAERISQGDLEVTFSAHSSGVYANMQRMTEKLREMVAMAEQKTAEAEKESDSARVAMQEAEEARRQAEDAKREGMQHAAGELEQIVDRVTAAATELSAQVDESARGSEVQLERTSETATAIEEMNVTVLEVARNATSAAEHAEDTKQKAEQGKGLVYSVVESIDEVNTRSFELKESLGLLGSRAEDIGSVMTVISDIADQTNLLALNAAIEAARAGDAGRGFAVVADEVRNLAEKTMQATSEVENSIRAIQNASHDNIQSMDEVSRVVMRSTEIANSAGDSLESIVDVAIANADQVRSIASASEEQSATSEQIGRSSEEINRIAIESAEVMRQSSQAVNELAELSTELQAVIEDLKAS